MRNVAHADSLNNTYNHYPPSSPLRPPTLFALISLLNTLSDLPSLPLSPTLLSTALSQWSIPDTEKVAFLSSASAIYESARSFSKALELHVLALGLSVDTKVVEKALVLAIAVEDRFNLDEVLRVQGVKDGITGTLGELVKLFTGVDELEAVKQGQEWLSSNRSYLEGFGQSRGGFLESRLMILQASSN